jgi:hypothetical protein
MTAGNVLETRGLLEIVLWDRIRCRPTMKDGVAAYELTMPIAFRSTPLGDHSWLTSTLASPTGFATFLSLEPCTVILAA